MARLICRFIFFGIDLLTLLLMCILAKEYWTDLNEGFFAKLFITVFSFYLVSAVSMIILVIFSGLHHFHDYEGVGDFFSCLVIAPITILIHAFKHLGSIFRLIFNRDSEYVGGGYSRKSSYSSSSSYSSNDDTDTRSKRIFTSLQGDVVRGLGYSNHIYATYFDADVSYENITVSPFGKITVYVVVKCHLSDSAANAYQWEVQDEIKSKVEEHQKWVVERVESVVRRAQEKYQHHDKDYSIEVIPRIK